MRRRAFLGGAAAMLATRRAWALGQASEVDVAEIQLSRGTLSRPDAWTRLLFELIQSTSVEAEPKAVQLAPDDPALFRHPFAVLVGDGALPPLSEAAERQLVRYLSYGGFLLVDDATGQPESDFDVGVRALARRLFPTRPLTVLPTDHSVYRSFFLLDAPVGRIADHRRLEGVVQGSMHPFLYMRDDLSGALDRRPDGSDRFPCTPGGEDQRREAVKLGINLVMYALTSNYKQDQAHVRELMREGRLPE
ncbi:MAG: DUF4159 domain-containing protein [Myxococcota bacterium]